jgi:hypothetical protein
MFTPWDAKLSHRGRFGYLIGAKKYHGQFASLNFSSSRRSPLGTKTDGEFAVLNFP